ncbi:MAG: hypothetical protein IRY99_13845 [Isosphaeraceae bacterium]|nr:hypothetical protein [Isosphaeraceae bacterium]
MMPDLADLIRRAWPVFLEAIRMGRTITYTELAGRVGPPLHRRHLHRQLLTPLSARCRQIGWPDLAALVVRKDTGQPGAGWHGPRPTADPAGTWAEALAACFAFRWPSQPDPRLWAPLGHADPSAEGPRLRAGDV